MTGQAAVCHVDPVNKQEAVHVFRVAQTKFSQKHRAVMMLFVQVNEVEDRILRIEKCEFL